MTTPFVSIALRKHGHVILPRTALFWRQSNSFSSAVAFAPSSDDDVDVQRAPSPLVELQSARLGYTKNNSLTPPIDLHIQHPSNGGHLLLSRNSMGKTLVANGLVNDNYVLDGSLLSDTKSHIAHVSFESHQELLQQGGTVYKHLSKGSNLNKAAQFLVVRFGLFPLLHRDVSTLSTGEIRKVLIVKALSSRPSLLILDNVFDGLDVASREKLKDLISKTLKGFRPDILVQGVSAKATAHTQVILLTHRAEEMVPEMTTVSYFCHEENGLVTESRDGRDGEELLRIALGMQDKSERYHYTLTNEPWNNDNLLPSVESIAAWWRQDQAEADQQNAIGANAAPLVQARNLCVRRGTATLLDNINWTVEQDQRWLVAGHNGSGKSTLSRLLARQGEPGLKEDSLCILGQTDTAPSKDGLQQRNNVGWVSTELHMALAQSDMITRHVLMGSNKDAPTCSESVATVLRWLDLGDELLSRPFSRLSQGEQKLILLASAIASRPRIFIVDEPLHGLDAINRSRVLGLVERLCQASDMSLIYITHHYEEVIPSVTHVLHLEDGREIYSGSRQEYNPDSVRAQEDPS